jgi:hypothetical protein
MAINRYICKVIRYLNKLQFYLLPTNQVKSQTSKRKEAREEKKNKKTPEADSRGLKLISDG